MLAALSALANPLRLRVIAALAPGRNHVSQLARDLQISRPLLYLHLQKLEGAGLVSGQLELSPDGRAMKYFEVSHFALNLTPESIRASVETLSMPAQEEPPTPISEPGGPT